VNEGNDSEAPFLLGKLLDPKDWTGDYQDMVYRERESQLQFAPLWKLARNKPSEAQRAILDPALDQDHRFILFTGLALLEPASYSLLGQFEDDQKLRAIDNLLNAGMEIGFGPLTGKEPLVRIDPEALAEAIETTPMSEETRTQLRDLLQ
jgi:hypothetical protein